MFISLFMVSTDFVFAYLYSNTSKVTNIFKPIQTEITGLTIINKINHPYGNDYVIPDNIEFEYEINLGDFYSNYKIETSIGEYTANKDGIIKVKIKANEKINLTNIDTDTNVVVKEITKLNGFTNTEVEKNVLVSSNEESKIEFLSTYSPKVVSGNIITLKGTKVLEGRDWKQDDLFEFLLEIQVDNNWKELGRKKVTYDENNKYYNEYNFNDIISQYKFNNIGVYKFRLSEIKGKLESIDYDKTVNNFEIIVTDNDMNGYLEINNVKGYQNVKVDKKENNYNLSVIFNNLFVPKEIEYVDNETHSKLDDETIIVRNQKYDIKIVLNKFVGLDKEYTYEVYGNDDKLKETNDICTGDYIKIYSYDEEYTYNLVLLGDLSGDGEIDSLDLASMLNHVSEKRKLNGVYKEAAYMTEDDEIDSLDLAYLLNRVAGKKGY